jgi:hypothetical protein
VLSSPYIHYDVAMTVPLPSDRATSPVGVHLASGAVVVVAAADRDSHNAVALAVVVVVLHNILPVAYVKEVEYWEVYRPHTVVVPVVVVPVVDSAVPGSIGCGPGAADPSSACFKRLLILSSGAGEVAVVIF